MSTQRRIRRSNEKLKTKQVETAVEKRPKLAQRHPLQVTLLLRCWKQRLLSISGRKRL